MDKPVSDALVLFGVTGDAMHTDISQFDREDGMEAAWRIVDPVLTMKTPVPECAPGSW